MAAPIRTVAGSGGDPLAEAIELTSGNPDVMRRWFVAHTRRPERVVTPAAV